MKHDFQTIQKSFAAHIRNPQTHSGPQGLEARRLKIYSDLFYNNVESFIARSFPVLKKIYSDTDWHLLVRDFFEHHSSHSPYFCDISQEFLHFIQEERVKHNHPQDPPFLIELAHYEWTELALEISQKEIPNTGFNPDGKMLHSQIVVSPLAWLLNYQWPVHLIGPNFQPLESNQSYFIIMYRTAHDTIKFMEVSAISARLLSIIQENTLLTGTKAIQFLSNELKYQGSDTLSLDFLLDKGEEALLHLRDQGIILGTRINSVN